MVQSKLKPDIQYKDNANIDPNDANMECDHYYEIVFDKISPKKHQVVFGNMHYAENRKVVYYCMYILVEFEVKQQIGVIEFMFDKLPKYLDDEGDFDENNLPKPLLYNFVDAKFFEDLYGIPRELEGFDDIQIHEKIDESTLDIEPVDDVFSVSSENPSTKKLAEKDDLFENKKPLYNDTLFEETKQDAFEIKTKYKRAQHHNWVQKFMKNTDYDIIDNEGGGDCLFAVIRDAYIQMGKHTTVSKLRELLSLQVTKDIFDTFYNVFLELENNLDETKKQVEHNRNNIKEYKKRYKTANIDEKKTLLKYIEQHEAHLKELVKTRADEEQFLQYNFGHMKHVNTLDKYREYIKTSAYWADEWAISELEYKLNMKMIILSEESYNDDALDSVLKCGEFHKKLHEKGTFQPQLYIITCYTGNHYKLITYKRKKFFQYTEIPYDLRSLIINKCLERNSGAYSYIEDFKTMKKTLGVSNSEDENQEDIHGYLDHLYDDSIVFMFHEKSEKKAKPGKGSNEKIPQSELKKFENLHKMDNWRRKLDDSFVCEFTLDNRKWASVIHYYNASKYKKTYPDYYHKFSLDSESDLSKEPKLAKEKGSMKKQDKHVSIDPDFYDMRHKEEKMKALHAKFSQNSELNKILVSTEPAKLLFFRRGREPLVATSLMEVRKNLIKSK